ncbi:SURF1-like protein [Pseudorhodoferax aquiterrae]|uniref:SURF1-like protein n=1 Tax=Pseudorhodoferax aquiterrae TaxID=747304 RepID=A0ABQ3G5R2_9BURK|nr:SURF1 family protein [Pseudorhodoferax aquiterrae]GHC92092.1 SURF1-like protein [Pseudorhodoferax aquiterrae]
MKPARGLPWVLLAAALLSAVFALLGTWQVQRLGWKKGLIARTEARVAAAPVAPPDLRAWPAIQAAPLDFEYRRLRLVGEFLHADEALVQASTAMGAGFWVLTPLRLQDGSIVLVNRGFVPPERRDPARRGAAAPAGPVTVTGLLRISEPHGGFLRENDPAANRWHSRDVAAIAAARGLPADRVAPYFVDAEATPPGQWPVGGLTVLRFSDNHLVYALTWFALAAMVAAGGWYAWRSARRPSD